MADYIQEYRDTQRDLERYLKIETNDELAQLVKELLIENKQLKEDNAYYRCIDIHLSKADDKYLNIYSQEDSPMAFDSIILKSKWFLTITFDPKRFSNFHLTTENEQKKYILLQLYKYRTSLNFMYGCFEKHKNGVVHAHILIDPIDPAEFKYNDLKKLKSSFTRNNYSKITIDYQEVKAIEKVIEYIDHGDKQKYGFFQYYNSQNYL